MSQVKRGWWYGDTRNDVRMAVGRFDHPEIDKTSRDHITVVIVLISNAANLSNKKLVFLVQVGSQGRTSQIRSFT